MKTLTLDLSGIYATVPAEAVEAWREKSDQYQHQLHTATGLGNDFLGWINLPNEISDADFSAIEEAARDLQQRCDYVVSIGIGGSYLGARAVIEALTPSFEAYRREHSAPQVIFAGHNIGEDYLSELVDFLQDKRFGLINISKSGTTTEPAIAFRILKALLEKQVGREEARERIIAVTDKARGALRTLADKEGYKTFIIPDDIGGRFSVLTPVGLLPIAVAGFDIRELVRGAREMKALVDESVPFDQNPAALYAAARNSLYHVGKKIEILGNFHPRLHYIGEWWKQLYGESEGKDHKGIFNAAVDFSADLHSMGQWIQEGERNIFETIISIAEPNSELRIEQDEANLDGLNYLAGKRVDEVNKMAELGTRMAHISMAVCPTSVSSYLGSMPTTSVSSSTSSRRPSVSVAICSR